MLDRLNKFIYRYFKVDISYLLRSATFLSISTYGHLFAALLLSVAFARLTTTELYGQFQYIVSIISMLVLFSLPGINTSITQGVSRGTEGLLSVGTSTKIKWSILGSIACIGFGIYYFFAGSYQIAVPLFVLSVLFPFHSAYTSYRFFLQGIKNFKKDTSYSLFTNVTSYTATIVAIFLTNSLLIIVLTFFGTQTLLRFWAYHRCLSLVKNEVYEKESVSFGKHITLINVPTIIADQLDKIVIGSYIGFHSLANYNISLSLTSAIVTFASILATAMLPKFAEMNSEKASQGITRQTLVLALVFTVLFAIGIVVVPYMIPFVYTSKYADSVLYTQLLFLSSILYVPSIILRKAYMPALKRVKSLYILSISSAIINIVLVIALVPMMGVLGAILVKFIVYSCHMAIAFYLIKR